MSGCPRIRSKHGRESLITGAGDERLSVIAPGAIRADHLVRDLHPPWSPATDPVDHADAYARRNGIDHFTTS